jgi:hypothetical protein
LAAYARQGCAIALAECLTNLSISLMASCEMDTPASRAVKIMLWYLRVVLGASKSGTYHCMRGDILASQAADALLPATARTAPSAVWRRRGAFLFRLRWVEAEAANLRANVE